jgi:hypothetical protein
MFFFLLNCDGNIHQRQAQPLWINTCFSRPLTYAIVCITVISTLDVALKFSFLQCPFLVFVTSVAPNQDRLGAHVVNKPYKCVKVDFENMDTK